MEIRKSVLKDPGYYSAIRKDGILTFGTTGIDLETIILSKISQTEKDKTHMFYSYVGYKTESNK